MSNPLPALPARARQIIYIGYGLLVIVAGAIDAYYATDNPEWLNAAVRVLTYLGVPISALAATHVASPEPPPEPEHIPEHALDE